MQLLVSFIDAFTDTQFTGNPAAVIQLTEWLPESVMQNIAAENNLSETAFIVAADASVEVNSELKKELNDDVAGDLVDNANEKTVFSIRWFSPTQEISFCGHATLASAFFLFSCDEDAKELHFFADSVGDFVVEKMNDSTIRMNFPNRMPEKVSDIPDALLQGLSLAPQEVYRNQQAYIAVYADEQSVRDVQTISATLKTLAPYNVAVTAPSALYDFVSRYFWPASGGDEDPVTGSIHTGLAPLWAERLGKNRLLAYQASKRGGELLCEVQGDRVLISGKAVLYLEGTITVDDAIA
jgi:predicted PhzF superfamily epimerase YddE/YHI9